MKLLEHQLQESNKKYLELTRKNIESSFCFKFSKAKNHCLGKMKELAGLMTFVVCFVLRSYQFFFMMFATACIFGLSSAVIRLDRKVDQLSQQNSNLLHENLLYDFNKLNAQIQANEKSSKDKKLQNVLDQVIAKEKHRAHTNRFKTLGRK